VVLVAGLTVLVVVLVGLRLVVLIAQVVADRTPAPRAAPVRMDPCLGPFVAVPGQTPARSAEGDLVALLATGAISRERYRREMAALAATDAVHPLVLPPD
jgi:hypothetical protein